MPVILHVQDAHEDTLRILRWHPARKLSGMIDCFYGSKEIAEQRDNPIHKCGVLLTDMIYLRRKI